ncbi:MAG: carboxymuconolactone decarboxylase family protein [Chloroflexota bacterium]
MTLALTTPNHVRLLDPQEVTDPVARNVFAEIEHELGFGIVPNVFRAMAENPAVLEVNWQLFRSTVLTGRLPRMLKEMVGVVVSCVHSSAYARLVHLHSLGVQGVSAKALSALAEGAVEVHELSPTTVAVLRFAQRVARSPGDIKAADFAALRDAGLDGAEVLEVLASIQLFTSINLFTDAASVPIDAI